MSERKNQSVTPEYFLGTARIRLEHLRFESGVRDYDEKNVARLINVFKLEKCQREAPKNRIPAIISSTMLGEWQRSEQPTELLLSSADTILCLHGKHRVIAAREFLLERDQWWIVSLYDECRYRNSKS